MAIWGFEDMQTSLQQKGGSLLAELRVVASSGVGFMDKRSWVGNRKNTWRGWAKIDKCLGAWNLFPFTRLLPVCMKIP